MVTINPGATSEVKAPGNGCSVARINLRHRVSSEASHLDMEEAPPGLIVEFVDKIGEVRSHRGHEPARIHMRDIAGDVGRSRHDVEGIAEQCRIRCARGDRRSVRAVSRRLPWRNRWSPA